MKVLFQELEIWLAAVVWGEELILGGWVEGWRLNVYRQAN